MDTQNTRSVNIAVPTLLTCTRSDFYFSTTTVLRPINLCKRNSQLPLNIMDVINKFEIPYRLDKVYVTKKKMDRHSKFIKLTSFRNTLINET